MAAVATVATSTSSNTMLGLLPPSSSETRTMPSAAACIMRLPTGRDPVKVILSMPGWVMRASPVGSGVPVTRLSTPGGQARLLGQLAQADGGQRGVLAGLEHDRAPGGQRRCHLLGEQHDRRVPRDDRGHHPDRLLERVGEEVVAGVGGQRGAGQLVDPPGVVGEQVGGDGGRQLVDGREAGGHPVVEGLELVELVARGPRRAGRCGRTMRWRSRARIRGHGPVVEGPAGRGHGVVDLTGRGHRDGGDVLVGGRVDLGPPCRPRPRARCRR